MSENNNVLEFVTDNGVSVRLRPQDDKSGVVMMLVDEHGAKAVVLHKLAVVKIANYLCAFANPCPSGVEDDTSAGLIRKMGRLVMELKALDEAKPTTEDPTQLVADLRSMLDVMASCADIENQMIYKARVDASLERADKFTGRSK